jgi:hypothetical protein
VRPPLKQPKDYYIYRDAKGALVLSNQKPPENSKIIKQVTYTEPAEAKTQAALLVSQPSAA